MNRTQDLFSQPAFKTRWHVDLRWAATGMAALAFISFAWTGESQKLPAPAEKDFSPQAFQEHVKYLAGDKLKGRGNGSPELNEAAAYIAARFREAGLEPAGDNQTYFQHFTMTTGGELIGKNSLTFHDADGHKRLVLRKDFVPISFSAVGTFDASLSFAGYGITAPDLHYDDYQGLDVKDKIVIVLRHEPQEDDEKSVFAGKHFTSHSAIINKAINARNRGAAGMILVNDTGVHPGKEDELIQFGSLYGPDEMKFVALQVKAARVNEWLKSAGKTLDGLRQAIDKDLSNQSFALDPSLRVKISVGIKRTRREVPNVVGLLRGGDAQLRDQAIVIGAHYDHLGLGGGNSLAPSQTGQVHHGADDNASGTSGMLELVAALSRHRAELKRSIVFIAFAGEEAGLLGSSYYTEHPAIPLDQTIAMLNLDMIGRVSKNKLLIGGTGTSPDFKKIVEEANRTTGFELAYSSSGYGASDHMSFSVRQVPVLFFFSGLHADYHKPSDTWEKIDATDGAKVAQLVAAVTRELDGVKEKPLYVRVAEPGGHSGLGGGGGYGPYFGSIPDMSDSSDGVKFSDVRDGSPAAKAGFKGGDKLVDFGGMKVNNLEEFTYALRQHKAGDRVAVTVVRDGERVTRQVTLEVRK
ncbi:MAG: M20/M25/M40 family metallo-hydrolase [Acidobacteria bacterium]|nr:M20/M25/M40 family metallo-hydrolase [Acidobacteriota bacterium]